MIRLRGDTHGAIRCFFDELEDGAWNSADTLLVAGDFGFGLGRSPGTERGKLDQLARKPYTILAIPGNHENYDWISTLPEEERYGAPVLRMRDNVFWLQSGYVYAIEGLRIFVMGGASSPEADKQERLAQEARGGLRSWFPQELPGPEVYARAKDSLAAVGWKVDVILTHTAPTAAAQLLSRYPLAPEEEELRRFLDMLYEKVTFEKWYFGHFHCDCCLSAWDPRLTATYQRVHQLT